MVNRVIGSGISVAQDTVMLFSDFSEGGPMWTGKGKRENRQKVSFKEPFREVPIVQVALVMWDSDHNTNQRMDLQSENVTNEGFDLVFRTWGDTKIARVRASWMAIGAARNEDDWELY